MLTEKSEGKFFMHSPHLLGERARADTINISGLLVYESRLLNPKKLGNFIN
jgi:hypothetical protein